MKRIIIFISLITILSLTGCFPGGNADNNISKDGRIGNHFYIGQPESELQDHGIYYVSTPEHGQYIFYKYGQNEVYVCPSTHKVFGARLWNSAQEPANRGMTTWLNVRFDPSEQSLINNPKLSWYQPASSYRASNDKSIIYDFVFQNGRFSFLAIGSPCS